MTALDAKSILLASPSMIIKNKCLIRFTACEKERKMIYFPKKAASFSRSFFSHSGSSFFILVTDWMGRRWDPENFHPRIANEHKNNLWRGKESFNYRNFFSPKKVFYTTRVAWHSTGHKGLFRFLFLCVLGWMFVVKTFAWTWRKCMQIWNKIFKPENVFRFFKVFTCLFCCCLPFSLLLNFHAVKNESRQQSGLCFINF